jgi:hypothetical protein
MTKHGFLVNNFAARFGMFLALVGVILCCGCGQKTPPPPQVDPAAFDNAAPAIKQMWQQAVTESENGQFVKAIGTLRMLGVQPLSREQQQSLEAVLVKCQDELRKAANAGDAAAKADLLRLGLSPTGKGK